MFTGIVQGVGRIVCVEEAAGIRTLEIEFSEGFTDGLEIGGSVAVDGVCLTATEFRSPTLVAFDVVLQSLAVTTLADFKMGPAVNVERAAKDGAEIGGHPLSGHVDFSTRIDRISEIGGNKALRIELPEDFRRYVFPKGYIAINGASLTVSECDKTEGWFEVWLIPETRRATNLDAKREGDRLNVEIERGTQVVVDTVRDTINGALGDLKPLLESLLHERGIVLEDALARQIRLPSSGPAVWTAE